MAMGLVKKPKIDISRINLWNLTKSKTKSAIEYIERLEIPSNFERAEALMFEDIRRNALKEPTAEGMLMKIGYRWNRRPYIYDEVFNTFAEVKAK